MPESTLNAVILVADGDGETGALLARWLRAAHYKALLADSYDQALELLDSELPEVALVDPFFSERRGGELLGEIDLRRRVHPILLIDEAASAASVLPSIRGPVHDFLVKPLNRAELLQHLETVMAHRGHFSTPTRAHPETAGDRHGMVGESSAMRRLRELVDRAARAEVTVLVTGETGTGQELVARAIHRCSARAAGPMIAVNCGAVPRELQESELFGHERGAFSGAAGRRIGRFEQAHGGVILLDEVAELSPSMQVALLRILQERRFYRVGGIDEVEVDVRVIAATHRNLQAETEAGRFRLDLFYRLAIYEMEVPPLRDRVADILPLAYHFLHSLGGKARHMRLSPDVEDALCSYHWPGNVRELQNTLHAATVTADDWIHLEDLPRRVLRHGTPGARRSDPPSLPPESHRAAAAEQERDALVAALERAHGNVTRAMSELGLPRTTMYRRLHKFGLLSESGAHRREEEMAAAASPAQLGDEDAEVTAPGGRRLLIVEKDAVVAKALVRIAQRLGLHAWFVDTAEAALEQVDRGAPDGVLLDIGLDGKLAGREVMERLSVRGPPFWVYSGQSDEHTVQLCHRYGARAFWPKLTEMRTVLEHVRGELEKPPH